uniref:Glutathione peroxidase n=1 Tax=Phallusia mammillata TaxID=59560 RepID=A0A6F9DEW3_9ASCI|nr:gpx7 glutathione peroxidase 7 precursor [Phallusia mammillata]
MDFCRSILYFLALISLLMDSVLCGKGGFYSFKVQNIRGKQVSLEKYRGKVSLVVNLASECGYTHEHYQELAELQRDLVDKQKEPFTVLGFPCNQFGEQEPHDNSEIETFARQKYQATFPLFAKIDVHDHSANAAYKFLKENSGRAPTWNFWKYLLDGEGNVIEVWGPRVSVSSIRPDIIQAIDQLKSTHREL